MVALQESVLDNVRIGRGTGLRASALGRSEGGYRLENVFGYLVVRA
jgi:hypothetical protein